MTTSQRDHVLQLVRQLGIVRPVDLEARGIPRGQLYRLVRYGLVER